MLRIKNLIKLPKKKFFYVKLDYLKSAEIKSFQEIGSKLEQKLRSKNLLVLVFFLFQISKYVITSKKTRYSRKIKTGLFTSLDNKSEKF